MGATVAAGGRHVPRVVREDLPGGSPAWAFCHPLTARAWLSLPTHRPGCRQQREGCTAVPEHIEVPCERLLARAAAACATAAAPPGDGVRAGQHRQAGGEPCRSGGGDRQWCGSQQKLACACSLPQCERQQAGNRSVTARGSGQELASRRCPSCLPEAAMTA